MRTFWILFIFFNLLLYFQNQTSFASSLMNTNETGKKSYIKENNGFVGNVSFSNSSTNTSFAKQASIKYVGGAPILKAVPMQYQIAFTKTFFVPFTIFNNANLNKNDNTQDVRANILSSEGGLVNGTLGPDFQLTSFGKEDREAKDGVHLFVFGGAKYIAGTTVNGRDVSNFPQYQYGVKLSAQLPTMPGKANVTLKDRNGCMEIGTTLVGNVLGRDQYKLIYGDASKRGFFYQDLFLNFFVANNISLSATGTIVNTNKDIGKTASFSLSFYP